MKFSTIARAAAIAFVSGRTFCCAGISPPADGNICSCHPDPHFIPFQGSFYDYHGGCKLVLLHLPGLGLHVHVSTQAVVGYSLIDQVGIEIGGEQLVIDDNTDFSTVPSELGSYEITHTTTAYSEKINLSLGDEQYVEVLKWGFALDDPDATLRLSVSVLGKDSDFHDAEGMCGPWSGPILTGRSGNVLNDPDAMAHEWRVGVGANDPDIIGTTSIMCDAPITWENRRLQNKFDTCPNKCICDEKLGKRCPCFIVNPQTEVLECVCANEGCVTETQVERTCKDAKNEAKAMCEYDVSTTGDVEWGDYPFYNS